MHFSRASSTFATPVGKRLQHALNATRLTLPLASGARIELVVADDGVAFRQTGFAGSRVRYQAPAGTRGFLQRLDPSYEGDYTPAVLAGAAPGKYAYPALLAEPDGGYTLLTESGLPYGRPGEHLTVSPKRPGALTTASASPAPAPSATTAWRVVITGSLAQVVGSDLPLDLAAPSKIADTSWIRPGRAAWSWWSEGTVSGLAQQERYTDFAAREGLQYVLVDYGWNASWIPALVDYAARKGVRVILWTDWHALADPAQRAAKLDEWAAWGVAGVKVDFFQSDRGERMAVMEDIAAAAAQRHLVVDFHGCTLPRGLQRTWPNVLTVEAARGAEYERGGRPDNPALNVTLAFTRNAVGSMDYTPVTFSAGARLSTAAAELAQSVVYESGLQDFADSPAAYLARPAALQLLSQVPAAWDDTRLIDGAPGVSVTLARRSGERWFVGSLSATAARVQRVPLSFLAPGRMYTARIYADGGADQIAVSQLKVTAAGTLNLPVAPYGGFTITLTPAA